MDNPVWSFEKTTSLTVSEIEALLFDLQEGNFTPGNLPFILSDRGRCNIKFIDARYVVEFIDGHKEFIEIDKANHTLAMQGEWWYRGLYALKELPEGTKVTLNVYNVAERFRWVASLMIVPDKKKHQQGFEIFVSAIEQAHIKQKYSDSR